MSKIVDIISRKTAVKQAVSSQGNLSIALYEPSIVQIHSSATAVDRYERQGNDLLIYMKDGSVIRCNGYFVEDSEHRHGELVFADGEQGLTHVTFANAGVGEGLPAETVVALQPVESNLGSLQSLMIGGSDETPWGWIAAGVLGGALLGGVIGSASRSEKTKTEYIDNTQEVEIAKPTFLVTDNQGDSRGVLSDNAVTDDTNPTFSGTGQAGATIQIKDASGMVIASAQVGADGKWSAQLPTQSAGNHEYQVVEIVGDKTIDGGKITLNVVTAQARLEMDVLAGDNMMNAAEHGNDLVISGNSSELAAGTALTVTLNGKTYTTTVDADGTWSVTVPAADASALADGSYTVSVTGTDVAGNIISGSQTLIVDTTPPMLAISSVAGDDVINAAEAAGNITISGSSSAEAGQTVTVELNGKTYTGQVGADGSWSISVPAADASQLTDGAADVKVSVSDKAGNETSLTHPVTVDTTIPSITVNSLTDDNILNATELSQAQIFSGSCSGAAAGDKVVIMFNGQSFTGVVAEDGTWSVGVPASAFNGLPGGDVSYSVTITDAAGNVGTLNDATFAVDVETPDLSIATLAGDDVLNAVEKSQPLEINGSSSLPGGVTVTVTLNGINYTAITAADGSWSVSVPVTDLNNLGNANYTISASATNDVGNNVSASHSLLVDSVLPAITINPVTSDDVLNLAEVNSGQTLSGRVSGAAAGDTVTVILGGKTYTTTVNADMTWSVNVSAADLTALGNGALSVDVSVTNGHGNTGNGSRDFTIDAGLPGLRIDTVAGDDIVNALEHQQALIVSGSSTGVPAGNSVTVTINGKTYPATVQADGSWSLGVPAADVQNWPAGQLTIIAEAQNSSGNASDIGHVVMVDLTDVAISIDTVAQDNMLNAVEKGSDLTLSGSTQNVEAGQVVKVVFAGHGYDAVVQADGSWSVTVPAANMTGLRDGDAQVQVSVTNSAGNSASSSQGIVVDTTAPTLTIDTIAGDNIINAAEAGAPVTISGTSNAEAGQPVTLNVNGTDYQATVGSDGTWSVNVDASALADGDYTVTASVSDKAGNPAGAGKEILVDTVAPAVTINIVAGDDIINASEQSQDQVISGSSTGGVEGNKVTVTIDGHTYTTILDASGNWSVGVPASVISGLADGQYTIEVSVTDVAGNTGSASREITVDTVVSQLVIDDVAGDNVLNAVEKGQPLDISGASNLAENTTVTVVLNGVSYTATTAADGSWSVTVPVTDLNGLGNANYTISASATNDIGNPVTGSSNLLVDTAAPVVVINPVTSDDVLNLAEVNSGQTLSGRVSGAAAGDTVTVILGGKTYTTTVNADLTWSVNVSAADLTALGNGALSVDVSVTNGHGNTGNGSRDFTIDAGLPGLRIDTVAGDDIVNALEHQQALIVSGSSTGVPAGNSVTVTINGKTYPATVLADGSWSLGVPAADVQNWPAGQLTITAEAQNSSGNASDISHVVMVDLAAVAVSIDTVAQDNVLNAVEKGTDLTLSGSTQNVEAGQVVKVVFAGHSYDAVVQADGTWSVTVPANNMAGLRDGDAQVQVSVTNAAGNSASSSQGIVVDATAPTLTIDTIASDNVINAAEASAPVTISGTSSAEAGQPVTVTINGTDYQATVGSDGTWSVDVDASALTDGNYTVTASVSDKAGNPGSVAKEVGVNVTAPVVTIDTVAGDDIINASEHGQSQIISGSSTGGAEGDKVSVTINGHTYTTTLGADGTWSVGVPADVIGALTNGGHSISVSVTDSAGNTGNASHTVTVNTAQPVLTIDTLSGDDMINALEAGQPLVLSGTASQLPAGTAVTVTLNGVDYTAIVTAGGTWSVTVDSADVSALTDGNYTVTAHAADSAGNGASASHNIIVDTLAPTVTISDMAHNNVLNGVTITQDLVINGTSSAEAGQTVTVTLGSGSYLATVNADGTWSVTVPAADLGALNDGNLTVTASVADKAGNEGDASHGLKVDTTPPTLTIDTIAGDNVINSTEQQAGQVISGHSDAEPGQAVSVIFNGRTYTTTVGADGSWQVTVPAKDFLGAADGGYTVTVSLTDQAGNVTTQDKAITLSGDRPTLTIDTIAGDDIINAAEHGAPLVLSGTSDAIGKTVTLTLNGKTYTTTVQPDGTWSHTVGAADVQALADGGAYVVGASVSNGIGNGTDAAHTVTVDITAPQMSISIDSLVGDSGLSATDFVTNLTGVTLKGSLGATLGAGEKAQISLDGGVTWIDLVVNGTGWSYTDGRTLSDNAYDYTVRVIDQAGNVGATDSQTVVIDTVAPDAAVKTITIDAINTDTGLSDNDFITSDQTLALSGKLGAALGNDEFAQISLDGGNTWINVEVSGLNWTYIDGRTLPDGNYNYMVRVVDLAGNVGATTNQVVTVDTISPDAAKTITIDGISDDTGLSNADFVTSDTSLTLNGTLGAMLAEDERAQISLDGGQTWHNVTVIGTSWSFTDGRTLIDGTYSYYVRVVDLAGNVGEMASRDVVIDTIKPDDTKTITITGISDDTGLSGSDYITSDNTLTVRGTLGAALASDEFAQISVDGGLTWVNVTVAADGLSWTYTDGRTLPDGTHEYQVRVVDLAGNVGESSSQTVLVDTRSPDQALSIDSISEDTGRFGNDFITSDTSLTINGSLGSELRAGEYVQISTDNGATWNFATVTGTQWSFVDGRTLNDGNHVYQVRLIDTAGNTSQTVSKTVVVDTQDPVAVATLVSYVDDEGERQGTFDSSYVTDDSTPVLNGVLSAPLEDGEVVYLYRNGNLLGPVTMNGTMNWTYADSGLIDGIYTYTAQVVDLAGNVTTSGEFVLEVDTTIPTTLALVDNQVTRDTTPIITGTVTDDLIDGQYVEVKVNGRTYTSMPGGAVVVDPAHNTWYLQVPDLDYLTVSSTGYNVTAQVKSAAGNGNNAGISSGLLTINAEIDYTPTWTTASKTTAYGLSYGLDSHGMWTVLANQQVMQSTDPLNWSQTALTLNTSGNNYVSSSMADYDRNGTADLLVARNNYSGNYIDGFTNYGDGSYSSAFQINTGTLLWYSSIIAFDREGDGYLDFWVGDAGGPDSNTFLWNNEGTLTAASTTSNSASSAKPGDKVTNYFSLIEGSGVDLNNDGKIDLAQHTYNLGTYYTLSTLVNQGDGTFVWGQNNTNTFYGGTGAGGASNAVTMTWGDFNGDGYMDLYLPATYGKAGYGSVFFNNGSGVLSNGVAVGAAGTTYNGQYSLAIDWNHDGSMDIVRIAQTGQSYVYTNTGGGSNWVQSAIGSSMAGTTSGVAAMDYDWDGAVDVLVTKQTGNTFLIRNTEKVEYGTSLHLRILDPNGINVYYGNTVQLYDSTGKLVSSQIINPQSGMGVNDASAIVNFYGLNANETYNAVLINTVNNVSSNIDQTVNSTWGGLKATDATHAYVLSAEAGSGANDGKFVGTGYNDTIFATAGTDVYDGSGGWEYTSSTGTWVANGGTDVVDFRLSTVGITVDLSNHLAQNTGFNTSTFINIEGISGSNFNDVITGSKGNDLLEGRGGDDVFYIGNGGHDTLLYKLLNASDATGGNGSDTVHGFTVGTWEGTKDTDRIDIRELLQGTGYAGNGKASYVNGVATLDSRADNIEDFIKVTKNGSDTVIQIDRDGSGGEFSPTTVVTLTGVQTDLATLLANHQLLVV